MGDGVSSKSNSQNEPVMKGWLFKWTNYLKGYQRRWFVLQNGHLSYYRFVYWITNTSIITTGFQVVDTLLHICDCIRFSAFTFDVILI